LPIAKIIHGSSHAKNLRLSIKNEITLIVAQNSIRAPALAVILVGEDPASEVYVRNKSAACSQAGISSQTFKLSAEATQQELEKVIEKLNLDASVDGILLQLPLPKHLDAFLAINQIEPKKDVDGLTCVNQGRLNWNKAGLRPCTPAGIMYLLEQEQVSIKGKKAVVIGRSVLVGLPVATLLQQAGATVTLLHSQSLEKEKHASSADILIAAAGQPHLIDENWVKSGAIVIDVGIHRKVSGDGLIGDVNFDRVKEKAAMITPVPGGVGPMTIALLLANTLQAYKENFKIS
jgi:methylenetetrahydrofolate dehydrogenase (NADP+)/methenyltetrahydrofolate cyclohydrolase